MTRKLPGRIRSSLQAIRTAWAIIGMTFLLLLLFEGGLRLTFWLKDLRGAPTTPDPRVLEQGYENEGWAVDHFRELERLEDRWEPFVYFRQRPFQGKTINVDTEGHRATWAASAKLPDGNQPIKLLFLGGSSLWGFGARDDHTIPSYVAKDLDRRGIAVQIRNQAEIGYVNAQELIALIRDLQANERPDYVIFYDGVNDTTSALLEGTAGVSTNESNRRKEFNILQSPGRLLGQAASHFLKNSAAFRFAQSIRRRSGSGIATAFPNPSANDLNKLADDVVSRYQANLEMVQRLGKVYGFRPLFFWQPTVFDKAKRTPYEGEEKTKFAWTEPIFEAVYRKIRDSAGLKKNPAFHDLSGIFADRAELVFIDYCHTTEAANEKIARAIVDYLAKGIAEGSSERKSSK